MSDREATDALSAAGELPGVPEGAQTWLHCTACKTVVHPDAWAGECPTCGNGTMREVSASPGVVPRAVPDVQGLIARWRGLAEKWRTHPAFRDTLREIAAPYIDELLDELDALIRAVPDPPVGWQPIETAPKDD